MDIIGLNERGMTWWEGQINMMINILNVVFNLYDFMVHVGADNM